MIDQRVHIAVLDDHQSIIDGYLFRLNQDKRLSLSGVAHFADELEPILEQRPVDILLLDISVPMSAKNEAHYTVRTFIPNLVINHPSLKILVISMHTEQVIIESLIDMGVRGYIFKNDTESIEKLASVIWVLQNGGYYFSPGAYDYLRSAKKVEQTTLLTDRQRQALKLCAAFPDETSEQLATRMEIKPATFRNTMKGVYERLQVHSRTAALAKAQRLGLLHSELPGQDPLPGK